MTQGVCACRSDQPEAMELLNRHTDRNTLCDRSRCSRYQDGLRACFPVAACLNYHSRHDQPFQSERQNSLINTAKRSRSESSQPTDSGRGMSVADNDAGAKYMARRVKPMLSTVCLPSCPLRGHSETGCGLCFLPQKAGKTVRSRRHGSHAQRHPAQRMISPSKCRPFNSCLITLHPRRLSFTHRCHGRISATHFFFATGPGFSIDQHRYSQSKRIYIYDWRLRTPLRQSKNVVR
jgi:hypothetical protein